MKIMINATAADARGALTVLRDFVQEVSELDILQELDIKLDIYVSVDDINHNNNNIKIITDYAKKSFKDKYRFEKLIPLLIEKHCYDAYFSMVNLGIRNCRIPQFIFVQSSMPFSNLPFEEYELKNFIKYKILLNWLYKLNINTYNGIFAQTDWVKSTIINKYGYKKPINILKPYQSDIRLRNQPLSNDLKNKLNNKTITKLLYVTSNEKYRNNKRLINAIHKVNENGEKVKLYMTIEGEDSADICYIGKVNYMSMYNLYVNVDALIFPSMLETLGLPLIEFQQLGKPILASDLPYAREVCKDNAIYFNPFNVSSISTCIKDFIKKPQKEFCQLDKNNTEGYVDFIKIIYNYVIQQQLYTNDILGF